MAELQEKSLSLLGESIHIPSSIERRIVADDDPAIDLLSRGMLKLYTICLIALTSTIMSGYAVSAMTAMNAMDTFKAYWSFGNGGIVFAMWPIGACGTFWLGPILADKFGRRGGMFICSLIAICGTSLVSTARNFGMLLTGRGLLGSAVGMFQPAAAPYVVELAPSLNRGLIAVRGVSSPGKADSGRKYIVTPKSLSANVRAQLCMTLGRRPMLIAGTTACATCLAFAMMCSAIATHGAATIPSSDSNQAGAKGAIAFLILFYGAYGWTYIPLLAVYGPEVLSTEQRSAGMGIAVLSLNLSLQLTTPIYWLVDVYAMV
ncbi:hypothetical protein C366_04713 [Cryptococcus neoformans Tu401-1]|nr:hypothetical protein C365_04426 [Cryptococcus neoformans var. grubii Bt85]OXG14670.1 hypothetical protein C366_04713 [Cryptococcus neoformans var. grubii Tu401-1]OXM77757.1 hypothetical protein C364_04697 [Cryptococcus neoformans var. grubii Bt63]